MGKANCQRICGKSQPRSLYSRPLEDFQLSTLSAPPELSDYLQSPKMFTLKKTMLLLFFVGIISYSLCDQERDADEEENGGEVPKKGVKRDIGSVIAALAEKIKACKANNFQGSSCERLKSLTKPR
ncbi:brevinin-2HS2A-like [Lithobates pipiens]